MDFPPQLLAMGIGETFQSIGAYIGIGGALIAVIMGALSARNKITIQDLQDAVNAKDTLLTARKDELDAANLAKHEAEFRLVSESSKLELLKETITQGPSIDKMIVEQSTQHKQIMQALANSAESQAKTAASVSEIATQMTLLVSKTQGDKHA